MVSVFPKALTCVSALDKRRLESLIERSFAGEGTLSSSASRVLRRLRTADLVVPPDDVPRDLVTMNSTVKFSVEGSGDDIELTLVYPKDVEDSGRTISILAPVGSALLGLSQGDAIDWPKPGGGQIRLTVKEVTFQPERSGTYHR